MIEITPKRFYLIGIVSLSIVALANLTNLILNFNRYVIWGKIASIGGIIFNFALVGLFKYLLSMEPKVEYSTQSDDINEIIEEVSKSGSKSGIPRKK